MDVLASLALLIVSLTIAIFITVSWYRQYQTKRTTYPSSFASKTVNGSNLEAAQLLQVYRSNQHLPEKERHEATLRWNQDVDVWALCREQRANPVKDYEASRKSGSIVL